MGFDIRSDGCDVAEFEGRDVGAAVEEEGLAVAAVLLCVLVLATLVTPL